MHDTTISSVASTSGDDIVNGDDKKALFHGKIWNARSARYYYDVFTGTVLFPDGTDTTIDKTTPLNSILNGVYHHARRSGNTENSVDLIIVAGTLKQNKPKRAWFNVSDKWLNQEERFSYDPIHGVYKRSDSAFKVYMGSTGAYFGECLDIHMCKLAHDALEEQISKSFSWYDYKLRLTPSGTGRDLLLMSLPRNVRFPLLPRDVRDFIASNFGQGRIEHFTTRSDEIIEELYEIDGTWMYASCLSDLPGGACYHDYRNEFVGVTTKQGRLIASAPGLYKVHVTVPEGWHHIGLIKAPGGKHGIQEETKYPNLPGETFTNWTTGAELALALQHKWHITILERYIWPYASKQNILENWRRKLVNLRQEETSDTPFSALLRAAWRSILLHTVGSFNQQHTYKERFTSREEVKRQGSVIPPGVIFDKLSLQETREGFYYKEEVPLSPSRERFMRPELAAIIWGKARARVADFALQLRYEDIVCICVDAIWCASLPEWIEQEYTGKPGSFRLKHKVPRFIWPDTFARMYAFMKAQNKARQERIDVFSLAESYEQE